MGLLSSFSSYPNILTNCGMNRVSHLMKLGLTTVLSFVVLFLPFLLTPTPLTALSQVIRRIFPLSRGLFEDKVANFWCASNVLIKWRRIPWLGEQGLVRLSAVMTAVSFVPAVWSLLRLGRNTNPKATQCPTTPLLPYALLTTSLSFFLFSFQVHEKTILLPLLPLSLLLSSATPGSELWEWGMLGNNVGLFR